jgi:hypothetical protein
MRPFPLLVRVGLFAVGFGAGLSHYRAPATPRPVIIQLHIVNPEVKHTIAPVAPEPPNSDPAVVTPVIRQRVLSARS